jgi:hypothetical protein
MPAGDLGLFLEAVQYINGFYELRHVHYPVSAVTLLEADFTCTRPNRREGFPVVRVKTCLDFAQLKAGLPTRLFGKCQQIVLAGAHPADFFLVPHESLACIKYYTNLPGKATLFRSRHGNYGTGARRWPPFIHSAN